MKRIIIAVAAFFALVIFQVAYIRLIGGNTVSQNQAELDEVRNCLLYTSPSPRDRTRSRMPSSA